MLAPLVIFATVLLNFGLCFINTNIFKVSPSVVIASAIVLIAVSFSLIWYHSTVCTFSVMLVRSDIALAHPSVGNRTGRHAALISRRQVRTRCTDRTH
jgi:hypothetical protein